MLCESGMVRRCLAALLVIFPVVESQMPFIGGASQGIVDGATGHLVLPDDIGCLEGPHAPQWAAVKKRFQKLMAGPLGPFKVASVEELASTINGALEDVGAVGALSPEGADDCAFGKLFIKLLTIAMIEDPADLAQIFQEHHVVASPVLTMLLDIPWMTMAQSGWPFFGILAKISYQKQQIVAPMLDVDAIDGIAHDAIRTYFELLAEGQQTGDMLAMSQLSAMYLQSPPPESPFALLTAMASQITITLNVQERSERLSRLQDDFRQIVRDAPSLDIALTTRWPLWGFLHTSADVFA